MGLKTARRRPPVRFVLPRRGRGGPSPRSFPDQDWDASSLVIIMPISLRWIWLVPS